jgi:hypothetical protein
MLIFVLGSACSVYGILRNGNQTAIGFSTLTNLTFIMDGNVVGKFEYKPSSQDQWLFNQLVFSKDDMNEGSHNLTVRLKPRSFFIASDSYLRSCHLSSRPVQFDYMNITSNPSNSPAPTSPINDNTTKNTNTTAIVAPIAGVTGALVIGIIVFWLIRRRKSGGVTVVVPHSPLLLTDHPRRPDSPPAHISPYRETPQEVIMSHPEDDWDQEAILLLAGTRATRDRNSLYDEPEMPVSSPPLHDPRRLQVASPSTGYFPSGGSSPQPTMTTYAPSTSGGTRDTADSGMIPNYAYTASESRDLRSALSTQSAAAIPLHPLRLATPSSSAPPPVQPVPQQISLYPSAVTAADVSQRILSEQALPPQPMPATTMLPPHRPPIHSLPFHPPHNSRTPQ